MPQANQNPEQRSRDRIDAMLAEAGWHVQSSKAINFAAGLGPSTLHRKILAASSIGRRPSCLS
jgi:type I site-specific restriction endonuclease